MLTLNKPGHETFPSTLEEWEGNPSRKLDILVAVLKHHLGTPDAPPLEMAADCETTVPRPAEPVPHGDLARPTHPGTPDKVVVYLYFVQNNSFVLNVRLIMHGTHY